jgi:ATP-dependent DNA helicase PIF1
MKHPWPHKHVFEAMNRTLQHIMGVVNPALKDMFFRGKVVVMGGDFRQILPVVPRGTRSQIVDASLKRSAVLWHRVKVRQLHENMCVQRLLTQDGANAAADAQQQEAWADYLQRIGEGTKQVFHEVGEEAILIPEDMCCQGDTIDSLVDEVYSDLDRFTNS